MKIDSKVLDFLSGRDFSNGHKFTLSKSTGDSDRDSVILNRCSNKKIIHLGFLDHIPLINKKVKENRWLHSKLVDVTDFCVGIDIDKNGVELVKKDFNINHVYCVDIEKGKLPEVIVKKHFDILLVSDVIEHIGDPLTFLQTINKVFKGKVKKVIMTTPNAFRIENFLGALKNQETINTDHKFWFSQYTLSKLIVEAGFEIEKIGMCQHLLGGYSKTFKNIFVNIFPNLKQTLVIEFVFKK